MEIFKTLPIELANIIIEFTGKIKIKNGRYQFSNDDVRYTMLLGIPKPILQKYYYISDSNVRIGEQYFIKFTITNKNLQLRCGMDGSRELIYFTPPFK